MCSREKIEAMPHTLVWLPKERATAFLAGDEVYWDPRYLRATHTRFGLRVGVAALGTAAGARAVRVRVDPLVNRTLEA